MTSLTHTGVYISRAHVTMVGKTCLYRVCLDECVCVCVCVEPAYIYRVGCVLPGCFYPVEHVSGFVFLFSMRVCVQLSIKLCAICKILFGQQNIHLTHVICTVNSHLIKCLFTSNLYSFRSTKTVAN